MKWQLNCNEGEFEFDNPDDMYSKAQELLSKKDAELADYECEVQEVENDLEKAKAELDNLKEYGDHRITRAKVLDAKEKVKTAERTAHLLANRAKHIKLLARVWDSIKNIDKYEQQREDIQIMMEADVSEHIILREVRDLDKKLNMLQRTNKYYKLFKRLHGWLKFLDNYDVDKYIEESEDGTN